MTSGAARHSLEYLENLVQRSKANDDLLGLDKQLANRVRNEARFRLLELFCEAVRAGETPHQLLIEHVSQCITSVYHNLGSDDEVLERSYKTDPRTVFLKPPRVTSEVRHLEWAIRVEQHKAEGATEENAIGETAEEMGLTESAVKRALQKFRKYAQYRVSNP
jgi:hypothetical protein